MNSSVLTMIVAPRGTSPRLALSAAGFIATSTSGASPGVSTSWSAKCSWKLETPGRVPWGARISAGKFGRVDRSLPIAAVSLVKRSPVSCIPSPESPAKRITTRSSVWTVLLLTVHPGLSAKGRMAAVPGVCRGRSVIHRTSRRGDHGCPRGAHRLSRLHGGGLAMARAMWRGDSGSYDGLRGSPGRGFRVRFLAGSRPSIGMSWVRTVGRRPRGRGRAVVAGGRCGGADGPPRHRPARRASWRQCRVAWVVEVDAAAGRVGRWCRPAGCAAALPGVRGLPGSGRRGCVRG